ncbi:hypothetical protein DE146DRAFT_633956 [Phaeosphaeria sp. MPI-PUGE-AT-0046c]|nr:hypothetical protein DE146DRAFT_633956 [Phaeosphaeria sp. MPI-PUGE-AT-0046c]
MTEPLSIAEAIKPVQGTSSATSFQSLPVQGSSMAYDMMDVQQHLSGVTLIDAGMSASGFGGRSWSEDRDKFTQFESLKNVALGNCRLLYGSERMKFYGKGITLLTGTRTNKGSDMVLGVNDDQSTFCVALVCSRDTASKILRTCLSDCPVKAMHAMVNQLQKDTMPLLMDFGAGSQVIGQQGYTHNGTDKFELLDARNIERPDGPVDDTETLPGRRIDSYAPRGAPRGPRSERSGYKRPRREADRFSEPRTPIVDARMADAEAGEIISDNFYD